MHVNQLSPWPKFLVLTNLWTVLVWVDEQAIWALFTCNMFGVSCLALLGAYHFFLTPFKFIQSVD